MSYQNSSALTGLQVDERLSKAQTSVQPADPISTLAETADAKILTAAERTKLAGVDESATANSTDAQLRDRATHTGTQAASTITGLGDAAALDVGTAAGTVCAGDDSRLYDARTPSAHTQAASTISDSTTAGRALLTAADAAAQRTALGLGTAAATDSSAYATAAQGGKADTALQPAAIATGTITPYTGNLDLNDIGTGGGASTFVALTDTPADYSGAAGKLVKVNPTGDALIFGDPSGSAVAWGDISGTISAQTDLTPSAIGAATAAQGGKADTALQPTAIASGTITPAVGNLDLSALATGTVTSVAVSGSDGIQIDSGSPITASGTIALGIDAAALRSHLGVESGATADQTAQEIATAIDADATAEATLQSALGLGSAAYTASTAYDAAGTAAGAVSTHNNITTAHGISAFGASLVDDTDAAAARTTLGLVIGTNVQAHDTDTAKTDTAQTWSAQQTFTETKETVFALTGTEPVIDPANGTIQTWTLSDHSTPTEALESGQSITLMIDDSTAYTITWSSVVDVWIPGSAPTLRITGYTPIVLWKIGTTVYGSHSE